MGLEVLVEGEGELLLGSAHGVRAVLAGGGVGADADAGSGVLAADVVELLSDGLAGQAAVGDAAEGLDHAVAELGVGDGGQGATGGPSGVDGWAGAGSGVRGGVGRHSFAGGRGLGNLAGENSVIRELANGGAIDLDETYALLDAVMIQLGEGLTVVVLLLEVHVDNTTGPDVNHLGTVDGLNLGEDTGRGHVATVFSEESGDIVGLELLGPDFWKVDFPHQE